MRDGLVAVTPSGVDYETMVPDDVVLVGPGGDVVDGDREPTSEPALHLAAHARPGTGAVVHTHSSAAVALSLLRADVPPVHYLVTVSGGVPVGPGDGTPRPPGHRADPGQRPGGASR